CLCANTKNVSLIFSDVIALASIDTGAVLFVMMSGKRSICGMSVRGSHVFILNIVDTFTKLMMVDVLKTRRAEETSRAFAKLFGQFGSRGSSTPTTELSSRTKQSPGCV
ncbi:MAG: uncharacterized protein A8A55_3587, partial [Amphiamblys sp. WSBS2006]